MIDGLPAVRVTYVCGTRLAFFFYCSPLPVVQLHPGSCKIVRLVKDPSSFFHLVRETVVDCLGFPLFLVRFFPL